MITEDLQSKGWKKKAQKKPHTFPQLNFVITAMEGEDNVCQREFYWRQRLSLHPWGVMPRCHSHTLHINSRQKNAFYSNQVGKLLGTSFPVITALIFKSLSFLRATRSTPNRRALGCHRCFYRPGVFMSHITRKGRSWSSQKQWKHPNPPSYRAEFYSMAPKTLCSLDWGTTKSLQPTCM